MIEQLYKVLWTTKGCRFNAERRLIRIKNLSTLVVSFYSVLTIAIGVKALLVECQIYLILNIFIGVAVIAITLIEDSQDHKLKAERLYNSGLDIDRLYRRVTSHRDGAIQLNGNEITGLWNDYHAILRNSQENHKPIDHHQFKAQNYSEFGINPVVSWGIGIYCFFAPIIIHILLGLVGFLFSYYLLFKDCPKVFFS